MAGIMDFFTSNKTQQATSEPASVAPTTKQQQSTPTVSDQSANNPSKTDENPLDTYQKVFDNAAKDSNIQAPSFSLDPKVIGDVSSKMDFTKGVSPELVQKANGGDASAMFQLMQEIGRNSYRAAIEHTTKLTDTHLGQRAEFDSKQVQRGVKKQLTSDALASTANLSHPLVKAELNKIAERFANSAEYADASPKDIAEAAKAYFNEIHAAFNPPAKTKEEERASGEVDYMKYLTGN